MFAQIYYIANYAKKQPANYIYHALNDSGNRSGIYDTY
jgi:hypothetical protein